MFKPTFVLEIWIHSIKIKQYMMQNVPFQVLPQYITTYYQCINVKAKPKYCSDFDYTTCILCRVLRAKRPGLHLEPGCQSITGLARSQTTINTPYSHGHFQAVLSPKPHVILWAQNRSTWRKVALTWCQLARGLITFLLWGNSMSQCDAPIPLITYVVCKI